MFDDNSRYKDAVQYEMKDHRGRNVKVVATPFAPSQTILGYHLLKQGQRSDHLAARYLNNAAGFWRIALANDAMLPEALTEQSEIAIPDKK
ncbi:MAG: hypothetical protein ABI723_10635 [Bacteroidia bacterium]